MELRSCFLADCIEIENIIIIMKIIRFEDRECI